MLQPPLNPQSTSPPSTQAPSTNASVERLGCVTAYAVLLGIAAVLLAFGAWLGGGALMSGGDGYMGFLFLVAKTIGSALLPIFPPELRDCGSRFTCLVAEAARFVQAHKPVGLLIGS